MIWGGVTRRAFDPADNWQTAASRAGLQAARDEHAVDDHPGGPAVVAVRPAVPIDMVAARVEPDATNDGVSQPGGDEDEGHATLWTCVWRQAFRPVS